MKADVSSSIVLVVEDELMLRMRAVDIVQDAGFKSIEAISADEAIAILETRDDISCLFTDIQMPGSMDGLKLAHVTHARWPHIKIILVSGQIAVTEGDKPEDSKFFSKPLEIEQMVLELRDMVGTGALKVTPSLSAENGSLTKENRELRYQLQQAGVHAKALLLKTVLDTEKQQLIIDENQPFQDALTTENDSLKLALEQAGIDAKALLIQSGIEAEERDAADKLQNLIHAELHHRIKNMLATVGAITDQSLRTATSMAHARSAIDGRFAALARAHDLLTRSSWENATIDSTVRSAIEPFDQGDGRFVISGEDIRITSSSVIAFAMTLNELCTNTTKFGALSLSGGRVHLSWRVDGGRMRLEWVESGGPPVTEPTRKGFGTRMITALGQQLKGRVDLNYTSSGFAYTLDVPVEALVTK
ncbi:HWE histidine kinase domain-containing protein [Brevundimonas sp.]|uniref:HWE histidine kinase domain-containing protein n=1 Tax=Brevundimonas sp. TaxID=1871086 RepID=UPI002D43DA7A|nr:HWE histidine kinase domain-containing protein [Brevundimonas sp.]HYC99489.1 HWE histidine kinase domain-containing protein [Brevundimonas sp.]